jgi:methionyl-tRNA formyltransferase
MGTPQFAVPALLALFASDHNVQAVLTQPPRRSGRGKKLNKSAVHDCAVDHSLNVYTPERSSDIYPIIAQYQPDLCVVVAYGHILRSNVLDKPKYGCLNIHASLLPRWRGAAPIHRAIMAGDKTTGVGIMRMDQGLDTGDIIHQLTIPIQADDTTTTLTNKLAELGKQALMQVLSHHPNTWQYQTQATTNITYANKISKSESNIDWTDSADNIINKIRSLADYPAAQMHRNGVTFKILKASKIDQHYNNQDGQVIISADKIIVGCNNSTEAISLELIKPAGKKTMGAIDIINGGLLANI